MSSSLMTAGALWSRPVWGKKPADVVQTRSGGLRGRVEDGIRVFRGVPFAQPPVGPLRFKPPQAVLPWPGVREATKFAPAPMQPGDPKVEKSEDCLYLNVWAPAEPGPHPVLVWIHGGGFTGGRATDPLWDGATFARQGIVCVTVAYRLGVFGFLDLGSVLGPAYAGGANNALKDLMLALEWLQTNVAAFGGDPRRVTIGGESAGAKLTDLLMGVPSARGLFQQMISESGGAERVWTKIQSEGITEEVLAAWKITGGASPEALADAPAEELIAAQHSLFETSTVHFPLRVEIDGHLLPRAPLEGIRAGVSRGRRLLLGTNRDESAAFLGPHPGHEPTAADLGNLALPRFEAVAERYRTLYPEMPDDLRRIRSVTAEEYWIPSLRVAGAHVKAGGEAFVYRFDYAKDSGRYAGEAEHGSELGFVWDRHTHADKEAPTLRSQIHDAWCAFIRGDAPAAAGLPVWPAYGESTRATMILDTVSRIEDQPLEAEFRLWDGLLER